MAAVKNALIWMVFSLCYIASADKMNKTAAPGQDVSLPCRAHSNTDIIVVEWTRPELEPQYVALYRDKKPVPYQQHLSFQGRVELEKRETKSGDVSLILKNVTSSDTGTYECRVIERKTNIRKKRANLKTEPISTIYLAVHQPGEVHSGRTEERRDEETGDKDGRDKERGDKKGGNEGQQVGLGAGLSALFVAVGAVGAVGAFIVSRKRRGPTEQSPYKAAAPDEESLSA